MEFWFGYLLGQMLDPILIGSCIVLYSLINKNKAKIQYIYAFLVACVLAFLAAWLASNVSGDESVIKISNYFATFIGFLIIYTFIFLIGAVKNKYKSKQSFISNN